MDHDPSLGFIEIQIRVYFLNPGSARSKNAEYGSMIKIFIGIKIKIDRDLDPTESLIGFRI